MATLITKNSSTTTSVPIASQLVQGELAVNVTDKRLFTENSGGSVVELGTNPSSLTLSAGTANGVAYLNGSKVLTTGSALTFNGTAFAVNSASPGVGINDTTATVGVSYSWLNGGAVFAYGQIGLRDNTNTQTAYSYAAGASGYHNWFQNGAEQMRLTSTGLGIGTSSPAYKLDVSGTIRATVVSSGNYAIYNAPTNGGYATYQASGADIAYVGSALPVFGAGTSTDFAITATSGKSLFLGSNAIKQATLDSAGNLGLGVTPSAWSSGKVVEVGYAGNSVWSQSTSTALTNNLYFNAGYKYGQTATATMYLQTSGQHQWYSAPSGTAGTAASITQAMTLDASGNLLVGQTAAGYATSNSYCYQKTNGYGLYSHITGTASGVPYEGFAYNGVEIGSITQSGTTAVLYNITSDARLKENIVDAPEFGSVIDSIKVRSYDWKTDQTHQRAGFIAQELVTVAPEAVHQPADPEAMMAVDYSKLVPMLVKEIQSLRKRLTALEAK